MKKKYDSETARKIINDYAEKLNVYICENNSLSKQLEDMKVNLSINKKIMLVSISENSNKAITEEITKEMEKLSQINVDLHHQKLLADKKVSF